MTAPEESLRLDLRTPEHVVLPFEVAPASHRFLALALDMLIMVALLLAILLLFGAAVALGWRGGLGYVSALAGVVLFFLFNFYFAASELRGQGRTFGKRKLGLRVVARDGGPLSSSMVLTRNLTRDLEMWLPLVVLMAPEAVFGDAPGWGRALLVVWMGLLALLPLMNRHRARLGDLLAGTVVVVEPKTVLLPDLVRAGGPFATVDRSALTFTPQQLDIYGIEELHVLEEILRRDTQNDDLLDEVAQRIQRKIAWDPQRNSVPAEAFLRAFYTAQRARLEQKILFGKRQQRKVR